MPRLPHARGANSENFQNSRGRGLNFPGGLHPPHSAPPPPHPTPLWATLGTSIRRKEYDFDVRLIICDCMSATIIDKQTRKVSKCFLNAFFDHYFDFKYLSFFTDERITYYYICLIKLIKFEML